MRIKVNGRWEHGRPNIKTSGVWKAAAATWTKVSGVWKQFDYITRFTQIIGYESSGDYYHATSATTFLNNSIGVENVFLYVTPSGSSCQVTLDFPTGAAGDVVRGWFEEGRMTMTIGTVVIGPDNISDWYVGTIGGTDKPSIIVHAGTALNAAVVKVFENYYHGGTPLTITLEKD